LGKVIGGIGGGLKDTIVSDAFRMIINGPEWVKSMAYRKAGWKEEPEQKRSLAALHKELETATDKDE
jgi:hypothetical protein